ncbi:MAG TPA: metallophosphoesterase [Saprospiraceae bacterium]|nr:metallophosphoesterase [Saprospiraceae bacterium]
MSINFRFIIPFLVFILLDVYAFQTFRVVTKPYSPQWRQFLFISYWALSAIAYLIGIGMITNLISEKQHLITVYGRTLIMILFVTKLMSIPFLLIDDIRRFLLAVLNFFMVEKNFDTGRSRFLTTVGLAMGAAPFALLTYGALRNPYRYRLRRSKVYIEGLPEGLEGFKIVQISDIHSGSFVFKEPLLNGVKMINEEKADLVVFTGDIVNYKADEMDGLYEYFNQIKAGSAGPVYSILGNHDYGNYFRWKSKKEQDDNFQAVKDIHKKLNWSLLLNEHRVVEHDGAKIGLIGVENFSALPQFPKYGDLKKSVEGMPATDIRILLSHDPTHWDFEVNKEFQDIQLMLAGHTHGFQFGVEIPGWFKWSPSQMVFKQWAGLYQKGKQYLYVNRGFGFLGYAGRVGILPEITSLTLTGKAENENR